MEFSLHARPVENMSGALAKLPLLVSIAISLLPLRALAQPPSPADADCMTCHEDVSLRNSAGKSVFMDLKSFKQSTHGKMEVTCVSCHADLKSVSDFPHTEKLAAATCVPCHDDATGKFSHSIHAQKQAKLSGRSLSCSDCHDAHNTYPASDPKSKISPLRVQDLCLRCHRTASPETKGRDATFVASYQESIHARVLQKSGLSISATCVTCHGSHDVRVVSNPASPVARQNIPATCGTCHAGIQSEYVQSIHGRSFLSGNKESPVCIDCHGEHKVQSASVPSSKVYAQNVPETCGHCHQDQKLVQQFNLATRRVTTFESTFHGFALRFGELTVANCASCHGFHDILPTSDPRSKVHPTNLAKTCGACHSNAGTNWAKGKVHIADPKTDNYGVYLTQQIYNVGITGCMCLFVLYIVADLWGRHRRQKGPHA